MTERFQIKETRSSRSKRICVDLSPEDRERVAALAEKHGITLAEVLRQCTSFALKNMGEQEADHDK